MRSAARLAVLTALLLAGVVPAATAAETTEQVVSIELIGSGDTRFVISDRPYEGPIILTRHADGLALTERATIEQYLRGIAEMPFSWPTEALEAQAVAARTYLTRTLLGGRRGDAARYEYDICATNRCQVYRGTQYVEGASGDRWRGAVDRTVDELVLYQGRPIEAVFTSMVGSRSRANQDVWASSPVPYLQPVDSPEIGVAPYAEWGFEIPADQFVEILRADGMEVGGELVALEVDDPPEGEGRTEITVVTAGGTDSILAPAMKGTFNRHGDELYPGSLPARTDGGSLLPEPMLSYTYDIEYVRAETPSLHTLLPLEDLPDGADVIRIAGEGWGHGVGMSQWGARIMAQQGATHDAILAHYYGGLVPQRAPALVPDEVVVGLAWGRAEFTVTVDGTAQVAVNGVPAGSLSAGTWIVRTVPGGIAVIPAGDVPGIGPFTDRPWPR